MAKKPDLSDWNATLGRIELLLVDIRNLMLAQNPIGRVLLEIKAQGVNTMTQLDDLNTKFIAIGKGIDNLTTELSKATQDAAKSFADLKALIPVGGGTVPDLTVQLAAADSAISKLSDLSTNLATLDADAIAADPAAVVPPPTPAP